MTSRAGSTSEPFPETAYRPIPTSDTPSLSKGLTETPNGSTSTSPVAAETPRTSTIESSDLVESIYSSVEFVDSVESIDLPGADGELDSEGEVGNKSESSRPHLPNVVVEGELDDLVSPNSPISVSSRVTETRRSSTDGGGAGGLGAPDGGRINFSAATSQGQGSPSQCTPSHTSEPHASIIGRSEGTRGGRRRHTHVGFNLGNTDGEIDSSSGSAHEDDGHARHEYVGYSCYEAYEIPSYGCEGGSNPIR
mmetsp:Transcript_22295/g.56932  ORF Transcript_22295/g.56932 Transcript_22295/m.56932 type:complete len:251 (+) Transcript_22295:275-1027(+)